MYGSALTFDGRKKQAKSWQKKTAIRGATAPVGIAVSTFAVKK